MRVPGEGGGEYVEHLEKPQTAIAALYGGAGWQWKKLTFSTHLPLTPPR